MSSIILLMSYLKMGAYLEGVYIYTRCLCQVLAPQKQGLLNPSHSGGGGGGGGGRGFYQTPWISAVERWKMKKIQHLPRPQRFFFF